MTDGLLFASYPVFDLGSHIDSPKELLTKEADELFAEWADRVDVRGVYDTTGFSPRPHAMFWLVSKEVDHVQDLLIEFRKTALGRAIPQVDNFLGLVRPAEFTKDHLPAFVQGKEPKRYMTVYPFVRTPEWYLLPPEERGALLRDHGEAGREFPDVWANTTSAFALGDYEWILCFEADSPDRLVDLLRRLRATEARRYTKLETPFYTGIRKELDSLISELP
jgi:chlorite dismutase